MMAITIPASFCTYRLLPLLLALMLLGTSSAAFAAGKQQKTFASPEKAVQRLIAAVKSDDLAKLVAILGPGSNRWSRPVTRLPTPPAGKVLFSAMKRKTV